MRRDKFWVLEGYWGESSGGGVLRYDVVRIENVREWSEMAGD